MATAVERRVLHQWRTLDGYLPGVPAALMPQGGFSETISTNLVTVDEAIEHVQLAWQEILETGRVLPGPRRPLSEDEVAALGIGGGGSDWIRAVVVADKLPKPRAEQPNETGPTTWVNIAGLNFDRPNVEHLMGEAAMWEGWAVLVHEPTNKHDPNAVMVTVRGRRIGYVPRRRASMLNAQVTRFWSEQMVICVRAHIEYHEKPDVYRGKLRLRQPPILSNPVRVC